MVQFSLVVVLAAVAVAYAVRHRPRHALAGDAAVAPRAAPLSGLGRVSIAVLAGAIAFWAATQTVLPIYWTGAAAGGAFVLAIVAALAEHDRSPLLLIPLVFVPLVAALWAAFVLLQ